MRCSLKTQYWRMLLQLILSCAFFSNALSQPQQVFSLATYNVQGMSDNAGAPFPPDYSASMSNWVSEKMYETKAARIAEALVLSGTPDIVAFQEIKYIDNEGTPIKTMWPQLQKLGYKYWAYGPQTPKHAKGYPAGDTLAVISKFPITSYEGLRFVDANYWGAARDPLAVTIDVNGSPLRLYVAHTKSKVSEKTPQDAEIGNAVRTAMLRVVRENINAVKAQNPDLDIVVVGDLNTNYTDSSIVNGLEVTGHEQAMLDHGNSESRLYNLWYEMRPEDRCTMSFMGTRDCIDHINISASLYDNNGIQYVDNSFSIAGMTQWWKSPLASATGAGSRWQTKIEESTNSSTGKTQRLTKHLGYGYSDHIPIVAKFKSVGNTGNTTRMTLAGAPSQDVAHDKLFFHIPYCTNESGRFLPRIAPRALSTNVDFSLPQNIGKCFYLENGAIPLTVVDKYDSRADYGFAFASSNPSLKTLSLNIQYDDQNSNGRKINRDALMQDFINQIVPALDAGKKVFLVGVKGRIDVYHGKVTIFAEGPIELRVAD